MSQSQVQKLCQILVESNLQLCQTIREGRFNVHELCEHFEKTAIQIDKLSKKNEYFKTQDNKPRCKEERRAQYNEEENVKLLDRIEKIKQERQKRIENDKKWVQFDIVHDNLIGRLNRLKPVKPVEESELDIYEILKKEEEEEFKRV